MGRRRAGVAADVAQVADSLEAHVDGHVAPTRMEAAQ